jgi:DNA-binding response OmpR family regulator
VAQPSAPDPRQLVLVVEDEPSIADLVVLHLTHAGFDTSLARDGDAALAAVARHTPAAIVLDIGLPGRDGIEVCRALRTAGDWTPVLFLTARDDHVDRVMGLDLGADDYISKPFSPRELVARVSAVLRRAQPPKAPDDVRRCGAVECDPSGRRVLADGVEVPLTATEFDLLAHLLASPGRVFTRTQLVRSVWGEDALLTLAGERTVDVHVAQLRAKLAPHEVIRTVRGVGYAARTDREHSPARTAGGSS